MGLSLWKKPRIIRRFKDPEVEAGYEIQDYEDIVTRCDVQTTDRSTSTDSDGDHTVQHLKVFFNDYEPRVADESAGITGDWIWFQGKWFECRSSRLSENTFLRHWTSTFVQCLHQADPPDEEGLLQ